MSKITFESDNAKDVDAFEDRMIEAMMDCRMGATGRCALDGSDECNRCPFSGELHSKKRKQP